MNNLLNKISNKTLILILAGIGLYLATTGISYAAFTLVSPVKKVAYKPPVATTQTSGSQALTFDSNLPRTESCPLNGTLYPDAQRKWWEEHRPLGVMIENHQESRPQSGLSSADVIYEAVAEGGITRLLAVFYCQDAGITGPVRSARSYFLDFISEYGSYPLYAHVGGANTPGPANALGQIEDYGWVSYNDLNQFSVPFPNFWRDYERLGHPVATEHTVYATTTKLWDFAKNKRKLGNEDKDGKPWDQNFKPWSFKDDVKADERALSQNITFEFWEGYSQYAVHWVYDKELNTYRRENGGQHHKDKNNDQQLQAKNVVILFMAERNANDGYENNLHLLYGTKGQGRSLIYQDGKKIEGTWQKKDRKDRLVLKDSNGREIKFNRGLTWFEILPTGNKVTTE